MSILRICLVLAVALLAPNEQAVRAQERPNANRSTAQALTISIDSFRHDALLSRFDSDKDGTLNDRERVELRDAFGGVDVPMLPQSPVDYTTVRLPKHDVAAELKQADNSTEQNKLTNAGAELGRVLFYDTQLSRNNTVACASCHDQRRGFSDPKRFSLGFDGGHTGRNSMGLANLRYTNLKGARPGFFWDERAATLEAQVLMPIQDRIEMGMELSELEAKLKKLTYYPPLFAAAFGTSEVTSDRLAKAVAQFLRSIVAWDTKFDRAADAADGNYSTAFDKFTDEENLGKSLFIDGVGGVAEMGCAHCHIPPTFGMPQAFNNGLDLKSKDRGLGALDRPTNDPFTPSNDGKFKASSLRNIALTAPYMHDGRFKTLDEVVEHYSRRVHPHENLGLAFGEEQPQRAGATTGFQLTSDQKSALLAFMKTLTDETMTSDPKFADPFVRIKR